MKKILLMVTLFFILICGSSCNRNILVVYTELGFAPFEYINNRKICGVDIDIMNLVGEKLGKTVVFENVRFDAIIDIVHEGKLANVGAAGLSITEERLEKVDFSKVYYQANLYVIFDSTALIDFKEMTDGNVGVYWEDLKNGKGIGVQNGTTADLFLSDEIKNGTLTGVKKSVYDSLDTGINDIGLSIDYIIIDELPAKKLCENYKGISCLPIYYKEDNKDIIAYDEYAICVTKGQEQLLNTINEVLDELLKKDENGNTGIQMLVNKHLGLGE